MYDEDIKIDADATALAQLIIQIVSNANKSETDEKIDALQAKIDSLENQIEEFDIHDHSYDIGEIAVEHINSYGGFTEMVTEVLDEYDFSDKETGVASGTTFTVTVD
jgi:DNA-directed RNA polymerase specialized sigma54-like protein